MFAPRAQLYLQHLVASQASAGTRFAMHASKLAPTDPAKLALLLVVCGYDVRRGDVLEVRGASGTWKAAPPICSNAPMPVLAFLRCTFERDLPARVMDANDERLDLAFASA